jgi:hypothetical protein
MGAMAAALSRGDATAAKLIVRNRSDFQPDYDGIIACIHVMAGAISWLEAAGPLTAASCR